MCKRYIFTFLFLIYMQCATLPSTGKAIRASYKAGQQVSRLEQAIKSNDPVFIKKEASKAKKLIRELSIIQANVQGKHAKCKENLAHLSKYRWGFWSLVGLLVLVLIYKFKRFLKLGFLFPNIS